MITVQAKDTSSPLSLGVHTKSSDKESFASLLHALGSTTKSAEKAPLLFHLDDKREMKTVKNPTKSLKITPETKEVKQQTDKSQLLSLLKGEELKTSPAINPEVLNTLDAKTLKSVIKDAKNYLKEQIQSTDAFKKGEIKALPKTLQGLIEVAKKVGIDVSKITIETLQEKSSKTAKSSELKNTSVEMKKDTHSPTSEKVQTTLGDTLKTAIQSAQKPQTEVKNSQTQTELKVAKNETPQEQKLAQSKTNTQGAIKEQMPIEPKTQALHQDAFVDENLLHSKESLAQDEQIQKPLPKQESLLMAAPAQEGVLSKLPLFTTTQTLASHSTAEFVSTKQTKAKEEHSVTKEPSLLGALLHGEKTPQSAEAKASITTDMNIKTTSSVLSQLLHGENTQPTNTQEQTALVTGTQEVAQDGQNSVHGEGASHTKEIQNDLSVKMNEAKQMTKYLAEDIKQAIEDYKAPFTRIKVKLNPQKLGEVDLTVVQRGKNIHVNISSNNSAIASLAQNVNELKMQLTQNGMNNATLNFSSAADAQTQQQQQNEQHKQGAKRAYEAFNQDKTTSEEMLTSLEIVLPQYI